MNALSSPTIQVEEVQASPAEVGYRPEKIVQLEELFCDLMAKKRIQGANYLMARHGKIFAWRALGLLSALDPAAGPLMPNSLRFLASLTKFFTAIAVVQLSEAGKLYLKQPVKTYLPEFDTPLHGDIRIDHLLTHTSGLPADPGYLHEPYPANWWSERPTKENWIKSMLTGPLQNPVGEKWAYCTKGFILLGEIIALVSGQPYTEYVRQHILEPLMLTRTFFKIPPELYSEVCVTNEYDQPRPGEAEQEEIISESFEAGGGLVSCLNDLWRVGQMMLNKGTLDSVEILSRKSVEAMTRNHLIRTPAYYWGNNYKDFQYGLGIGVSNTNSYLITPGTFHHEGAGASALYIDPTEEFITAFFVPFVPGAGWVGEALVYAQNIMWAGLK